MNPRPQPECNVKLAEELRKAAKRTRYGWPYDNIGQREVGALLRKAARALDG